MKLKGEKNISKTSKGKESKPDTATVRTLVEQDGGYLGPIDLK